MSRTIWLSSLALALVGPGVLPGALHAMPGNGKEGKKDEKVQTDSTKARKAKPNQGADDEPEAKKKFKPRSLPTTPPPAEVRPQDDEPGSQTWDTDFLVRNSIPNKRGSMFVLVSY